MTTYNTGNPVPSADARDRYDNSQTLDEVVNGVLALYKNRVGNNILSLKGMADQFSAAQVDRTADFAAAQAVRDTEFAASQADKSNQFNQFLTSTAYELPPIPYIDGSPLEISRPTQLISHEGNLYSVKLPSTFPVVLPGVWDVAVASLTVRSDQSLRQQLASEADGAGASLSAWKRKPLASGIKTVQGALDAQMVSVWESAFVDLITVKPDPNNPSTWDWTPAFQAAVNALKGTGKKLYIPDGNYMVSTSGAVVSPPYLNHPYAVLIDANLEIVCHGKIMIPMDPDKKCIAFLFDGCTGGGLTGGFAEGYWSDIDALTTRLYNGAMAVVTRSSRVKVSGISTKNTGAGVIITASVGCTAKDSISIRTDIRVKTGAQYGAYAGSLNLIDGCVVYGGTNDGDIRK